MRSAVNCTRVLRSDSAAARERISSVLATPGTPSSRTCPRQSRQITSPVITESWPTTALPTSFRTASSAARGPAPAGRPALAGRPAPAAGAVAGMDAGTGAGSPGPAAGNPGPAPGSLGHAGFTPVTGGYSAVNP